MNNTQDKKKPEEIHNLHYYIDHIRYDITNLIKWLVMAAGLAFIAICGVYGSGAGASFIYEQF